MFLLSNNQGLCVLEGLSPFFVLFRTPKWTFSKDDIQLEISRAQLSRLGLQGRRLQAVGRPMGASLGANKLVSTSLG